MSEPTQAHREAIARVRSALAAAGIDVPQAEADAPTRSSYVRPDYSGQPRDPIVLAALSGYDGAAPTSRLIEAGSTVMPTRAQSDRDVIDYIDMARAQRGLPPMGVTPAEIGTSRVSPEPSAYKTAGYRDSDVSQMAGLDARGTIKSGLTPWAERIAARYGPEAGQMADKLGDAFGVVGNVSQELTGIPQAVRAGEALAGAANDPSIGSLTNAGAQTALSVLRPTAAAKILAAGYGTAAVTDATRSLLGGQSADAADGLSDDQDQRMKQIEKAIRTQSYSSGAERRQLEAEAAGLRKIREQYHSDQAELAKQRAAAQNEQEARAAQDRQAEYDRAVRTAEAARNRELGRRTSFDTSSVKDVFDKTGGVPGLALGLGVGAGVIDRLSKGPVKTWNDVARVSAEGTGAAMVPNNWSLIYNAFGTPTDNPEKAAYQAYARELPDGHPMKARAQAYADSLPGANPVRVEAQREFYDTGNFAKRLGSSMLEGIPSALTGHNIPGAALNVAKGTKEGLGSLLPDIATGWQHGMTRARLAQLDAGEARRLAAGAQRDAAGAQRDAAGAQRDAAEAQRRKSGQTDALDQSSSPAQPPQPASSQNPASPSPPPLPISDLPPARPQIAASYGGRHKSVSQPLIESETAQGRMSPDAAQMNSAFERAGLSRVDEAKLQARVDTVNDLIGKLRRDGYSDGEIAETIGRYMAAPKSYGFKPSQLPVVLGAGVAANSDDRNALVDLFDRRGN